MEKNTYWKKQEKNPHTDLVLFAVFSLNCWMELLWSDPRCPSACTVMLREWLSSSGHGLCVPLKGSSSVTTSSTLTSFFNLSAVACVWGTGLCDLVYCWYLTSSEQAELPSHAVHICAQRRKDVFCTKATVEQEVGRGEPWYEGQLYSKSQSCHGKRARVPESWKFWQHWRQWA